MQHATTIKTGAVVVGAMILASMVVRATDVLLPGMDPSSLTATVVREEVCEEGMAHVSDGDTPFCIDAYEASPHSACPYTIPGTLSESAFNIRAPGCLPVSEPGRTPWHDVTLSQAIEACAKAGKRLPTAHEWYRAALGTPDGVGEGCALQIGSHARETGTESTCMSSAGAFDMVGNVWEWVDEEVVDGVWRVQIELPETGYVSGVDRAGVALSTDTESIETYGHDRLWSDSAGVMGVMRGGYYRSAADGGVYALYAASPPTFSGQAVGFRCVKDL